MRIFTNISPSSFLVFLGKPKPFNLSFTPLFSFVPRRASGGTVNRASCFESVGINIPFPKKTSGKGTGQTICTSQPFTVNKRWGLNCTSTYRSPNTFFPAAPPLFLKRSQSPDCTPLGIRIEKEDSICFPFSGRW